MFDIKRMKQGKRSIWQNMQRHSYLPDDLATPNDPDMRKESAE